MKSFIFGTCLFVMCAAPALAQTEIRFTNKELAAAFVLIRPELNSIEINGRTGVYTPAPALTFFGVAEQRFEIESSTAIQLVDIEFNHLKAKAPEVGFEAGVFVVNLPIIDQAKAIHTRLGSISFSGASISASLMWKARADGTQELSVASTAFKGTMKGTGALAPTFILNQVKSIMMKTLTNQIRQILAKQDVQDAVQKGLLGWSKFYSGVEYQTVNPGSVSFYRNGDESGLVFQVQ